MHRIVLRFAQNVAAKFLNWAFSSIAHPVCRKARARKSYAPWLSVWIKLQPNFQS
jgi:hypothetical protein